MLKLRNRNPDGADLVTEDVDASPGGSVEQLRAAEPVDVRRRRHVPRHHARQVQHRALLSNRYF